MKVLMLNGSWNSAGSTRAGLEIMAKVFAELGIESEIVELGAKPIQDCIACNKCAELKRCVFTADAVNDFVAKAMDSDAFVFGSPVYYAHPSGRVQSFLDRAFFSAMLAGNAVFAHKPAASIVVARRAGTTASFDVLNKYFGISNMITVGSTYWNEFHALTPDDVPQDLEGVQTLENLARNLAWVMKCIHAGKAAGIPMPELRRDSITNFIR